MSYINNEDGLIFSSDGRLSIFIDEVDVPFDNVKAFSINKVSSENPDLPEGKFMIPLSKLTTVPNFLYKENWLFNFWIKETANTDYVISFGTEGVAGISLKKHDTSHYIFSVKDGSNASLTRTESDEWHMITLWCDGTNTYCKRDNTTAISITKVATLGNIYFGTDFSGSNADQLKFAGLYVGRYSDVEGTPYWTTAMMDSLYTARKRFSIGGPRIFV